MKRASAPPKRAKTIGFGVPDEMDPHHFIVEIPAARDLPVVITENFGISGGVNGSPDSVERCRLERFAWTGIADDARRVLNTRLKEKGLSISRWSAGKNKVERLLGRELCVLAWAVEIAPKDAIPAAVHSWTALRPEERWWLFSMAAGLTGTSDDVDIGWRKAIRIGFTEAPLGEKVVKGQKKRSKPALPADRPQLLLFDKA